jgi:hypothetical protein
MGTEQVCPLLFLDYFAASACHFIGQDQIANLPPRHYLNEQFVGLPSVARGHGPPVRHATILNQASQPVCQHVVLLGPFFGNHGLEGSPQENAVSDGACLG